MNMALLQMGQPRSASQNLTHGKVNSGGALKVGTNTGVQQNSPSYGITLGQGAINQTPYYQGGGAGSGANTGQAAGGVQVGGGGIIAPAGPSAAQVDPILASLAQLDGILNNRNAEAQAEYDKAIEGYTEQNALDLAAKNRNVFQNENTFTGNNHAALLNAANASTGLRGALSGMGGLAGSGMDVVQRLTGLAANQDAGSASQTFETNAGNLNTAWQQAEREQRQRDQDAESTLANTKRNNEAQILNSRQGMFQDLAGMYGADTNQGRNYASKASALAAPIARTTKATVAPYAKASSSYSPGALEQYLAGTQNLNVGSSVPTAAATAANSPVFASGRRKDQLSGVA